MFEPEPPAPDNPLVGRPDVVCTPHLGASTREAQEEVAYEIAEAVIGALKVRGAPPSFVGTPRLSALALKACGPGRLGRAAARLQGWSSALPRQSGQQCRGRAANCQHACRAAPLGCRSFIAL